MEFLLLCINLGFAIYLFYEGFIPNKHNLLNKSDINVPPSAPFFDFYEGNNSWFPFRAYNKIHNLLIDALRFDYTIYDQINSK